MTSQELLNTQAEIFKALAHPSRLAMIKKLSGGECCVCELQQIVGSDMSTVSKHLSVLKNTNIVSDDKRGMNVYYTLKADCVISFMDCIAGMIDRKPNGKLAISKTCRTNRKKTYEKQ